MKTALMLVDIQNDYFPGGRMELEGSQEAASLARLLLDHFRTLGQTIIHVQHISDRPGASFFLPGTSGVEIHSSVTPQSGALIIQKHYPNSFRETSLLDHLHRLGIDCLVICGMMTHMCVDAAVRAAADLGFEVWIAADACATRALVNAEITVPATYVQAAFLSAFKAYGHVMSAEEILTRIS